MTTPGTVEELQVWRDEQGRTAAFGHAGASRSWFCMPEVAAFRFDAGERLITVMRQPGAQPNIVEDMLYRTAVPLALHWFGNEVLHASAVDFSRGLAVFCATAGTGKSTIAKALAARGHGPWADDAVSVTRSAGSYVAEPLPFRFRLRSEAADHFGVRETGDPPWNWPAGERPIAAVFALRRDPHLAEPFLVRRLSPVQAFTAMLGNAYAFTIREHERKRRMVEHYAGMARAIPCHELVFRPGLGHLSGMAEAIEREVA